jgi:hypothetical protein
MAKIYKVLGQSAPSNTNNIDLYTVPALTQSVISTIAIANTASSASTFRIFVRKAASVAAKSNAIVYDAYVSEYDTTLMTIGLTLEAGDVITVRSGTADTLTFHAFGSEIT